MRSCKPSGGLVAAWLLGIALQAPVALGQADRPVNPLGADPAAVSAGRELFEAVCSACHGPSGTGTERAPALASGHFKHGGEDHELLQSIQQGIPGTQMPAFGSLEVETIWQLVSYVRSLSRMVRSDSAPAHGDAARGEQLFFGRHQCSTCHTINGRGVPLAPDLSEAGRQERAALEAGITHVPLARRFGLGPGPHWVDVVLKDGSPLSGLVRSEDSFSLVLQTSAGDYRLLERSELRTLKPSTRPVTPAQNPSGEDKADLLAYLGQRTARSAVVPDGVADGLSFQRLTHAQAEPGSWLTYWGSYRSEHFSELTQINRSNLSTLAARWAMPMPGGSPLEATPLVVDGVMYMAGPPGDVYALSARSGLPIWKFHRDQTQVKPFPINPFNRGVAVLGRRVFVAMLDDSLIALDARSGAVLWEQHIADALDGYTMTGAPLALDGKVIVGVSGGEMGVRGFVAAFDAADGHALWRFDTIPGPGQPGHETWAGDSWKTGSGATWLTGSYDPQLHLLYWAVGNPGPDYDPSGREGDNLYTCTVLALDPETGRLVWYYQMTPHDTHDWDAAEDLILAEESIDGQPRHVLLHADRNGFFYTLDRASGKLLSAVPFVRQTWNKGFRPDGRPLVDPASIATPEGHRVAPGVGGTNFQAPSYDREGQVLYLSFIDSEGNASYQPARYQRGHAFTGAHFVAGPGSLSLPTAGIMALDVRTGARLWTSPLPRPSLQAGVLATRGEVVLAGTAEGNIIGLDARTGQPLWHFQTGAPISASPMSYAIDGTQFIAIAAGNMLYSFSLPDTHTGEKN
jgi:alcohol dehydrogenase (cytochrome c)